MGQKDVSTVVFNIVLHVIFIKLGFELERVSIFALLVIVSTIILSYIIIALCSSPSIARMLDIDLIGIGARSVLTTSGFLLVCGVSSMVLFLEYVILFSRYWRHIGNS